MPQNYTLDIAAGLTQVPSDEVGAKPYGVRRECSCGWQYYLGDALASVRQVSGGAGPIGYSQAFEPYGSRLNAAGANPTSYGFTGEWQDAGPLYYLRARYFSSDLARFVGRDSWPGEFTVPLSSNRWLYSLADPINSRDPSGRRPWPPDEELKIDPPNTEDFDPGVPPKNITWAPSVFVDTASQLVTGMEESQFYVIDPETGSLRRRGDPSGTDPNCGFKLCGQIALSMILETANPWMRDTLEVVWQTGTNELCDPTVASNLYAAVGRVFPISQDWVVQYHAYSSTYVYEAAKQEISEIIQYGDAHWNTELGLAKSLMQMLWKDHYVIQLATHDGGILRSRRPDNTYGHWVVLTGFSAQWVSWDEDSPWNWVRINNPYRNRPEYYPWRFYRDSLIGNLTLELWPRNPRSSPPFPVHKEELLLRGIE